MIRDVADSYRQAVRLLVPFLVTHVFFRLVSASVIFPLVAALVATTLSFSDQSAITDQDIARFILTPAGAIGGLFVGIVLIAAMVLDVGVMTATIRSRKTRPLSALRYGIGFVMGSAIPILQASAGILLRIILISLPFLGASAALYFAHLSEYDINYYLTFRPPEFVRTVLVIVVLLAVLALILVERLTGWAIVLHLALFARQPISLAFRESRRLMKGHRLSLLGRLAIWLALRSAIVIPIAALTAIGIGVASDVFPRSLGWSAAAVLLVLAVSVMINTTINACANGALADLLNDIYDSLSEGRFDGTEATGGIKRSRDEFVTATMLALVFWFIVAAGSIGGTSVFLDRITADADIEVIGHRGAAALRPENTMAAIEKAIVDRADWVEIDVQENADGEVIVAHDSDFMKAARNPLKVWDSTAEDLEEIDIGSWFDPKYADQRVPLLRDVLLSAKDRSKVIIELKYYGHDVDLENRVVDIVEETGMADQVATMSLKYPSVQKMRQLRPEWRTGVLAATAIGDLSGLEGDFLAVSQAQASSKLVQKANAAGKDVYAWTVNDAASMSRMISIGIQGLITDDPALAREVIDDRNSMPLAGRLALWVGDRFGVTIDRLVGDEISQ